MISGEKDSLLVVSRNDVERLFTMDDAIQSSEALFRALGSGQATVLPILKQAVPEYGGEFEIKAGIISKPPVMGMKMICDYSSSAAAKNIPAYQSFISLLDASTGTLFAIVDGSRITGLRTAAAGAVAAKYLARKDSKKVGVVGTGNQGRLQVIALNTIFKIQEINAYDISQDSLTGYVRDMGPLLGAKVTAKGSPEEVVRGADIVVTVTPSTTPYLKAEWISDGTHINAFGADSRGKQELDESIYDRAKLVVDKREIAIAKGVIRPEQIHAELGEVICSLKKGRESEEDITVFDSSGIGVQDIIAAEIVVERARERGIGTRVSLH